MNTELQGNNDAARLHVTPSQSELQPTAANETLKSSQRGLTPPIDGEGFTIKRCYQYRPSTIRKLNELKAKHPDVNAYLNTIIDEAISHYYDHVFREGAGYKSLKTAK